MRTNISSPEAYIAIGKNRQKIYGENTVFLEDKQEFEFEFFNPTQDNIMAKISINGKSISNRGLILRPGVRGWIERYIDEKRKFLFETYFVNGNSAAVQKAIENNGDIKIEFFKEKQKPSYNNCYLTSTGTATVNGNCTTYKAHTTNNRTYNVDNSTLSDACLYSSTLDYSPQELKRGIASAASSPEESDSDRKLFSKKLKKQDVETGRVEKGSVSGQHFTEVDMEFEYFPFHAVTYKLMPLSQKPAEFSDLRLKCKHCGTKIKSNWKVCPICANPINEESKCSKCGTKVEPAWKVCPMCGGTL